MAFWRHSICSAAIYRARASKVGGVDVEEAFVSGMLHDVGKLLLDRYAPDLLQRIVQGAWTRKCSFLEAERSEADADHAALGALLLERWRLAPAVCEWVRDHHAEDAPAGGGASDSLRAAISHFSDYLCKVKGVVASGSHDVAHLNRSTWERLGLEKRDIPDVIEKVNREIETLDTFMSLAPSAARA